MSAAAKALPRPCPSCGEVSGGVFCPQDGNPLEGAFSIGGDRYVVEELIGNGAMAIVFGGRHRTLSRPVAVKILRPEVAQNAEQQQRFLREARSASQLNHENIVGVLDFGWDDDLGVTYMVMERLFGLTLASQLGSAGRMPWREVMPLLVQICRALGAAHGLGIVHRDLSSRNVILVQGAGRRLVKLCDFGLSRQSAGGDRVTHDGAWVGTPAYMAPEQLGGELTAFASSDIYSIGVLAYEMLTGHLPIEGMGDAGSSVGAFEMVVAKLAEAPRRLAQRFPEIELPEELDALVMRCLELAPAQRPSAAELERMLVRIEARVTSAGSPPAPTALASSAPTFPALDDGTPTMIGSYRVVRSLGSGGTGRVYLGEHPVIGSKVAIKVLLPEIAGSRETVERFIQEARTSSQIESPHIPRYYDFGRTAGGLPYAVMEYFEGETLAERIEKHGALSVAESADILGQVAGALTLAHQAGLVHRDLKPENIFLVAADPKSGRGSGEHSLAGALPSADGVPPSAFNVKVLDFGIAKTFGKESGTRTQQGFFLGTPFYCAPEQVFGAEVDPRADVYGLGATAFEMLTGMPPFLGEIAEVLEAKTSREAPLLRLQRAGATELVEATVARMLARDPAARAPSMTWVQEQVARWLRPASQSEQAAARERSSPIITLPGLPMPAAVRERSSPAIALGSLDQAGPLAEAAAGAARPGSAPVISHGQGPSAGVAAAVTPSAPYGEGEPDLDVLDTLTMGGPGPRHAQSAVQIILPPRPVPLWRRPILLAAVAAAIVGSIAVVYLGPGLSGAAATSQPSGGASGGTAGGSIVAPLVDPAATAAGTQGERSREEAPAPSGAQPVGAAGAPSGSASAVAGDEDGDGDVDKDDAAVAAEEAAKADKDDGKADKDDDARDRRRLRHEKGDRRDRRDRSDAARSDKDPEPPKDVKIVDPFEK